MAEGETDSEIAGYFCPARDVELTPRLQTPFYEELRKKYPRAFKRVSIPTETRDASVGTRDVTGRRTRSQQTTPGQGHDRVRVKADLAGSRLRQKLAENRRSLQALFTDDQNPLKRALSNTSLCSSAYDVTSSRRTSGYDVTSSRRTSGYDVTDSRRTSGYDVTDSRRTSGYDVTDNRRLSGYDDTDSRRTSGYDVTDSRRASGYDVTDSRRSSPALGRAGTSLGEVAAALQRDILRHYVSHDVTAHHGVTSQADHHDDSAVESSQSSPTGSDSRPRRVTSPDLVTMTSQHGGDGDDYRDTLLSVASSLQRSRALDDILKSSHAEPDADRDSGYGYLPMRRVRLSRDSSSSEGDDLRVPHTHIVPPLDLSPSHTSPSNAHHLRNDVTNRDLDDLLDRKSPQNHVRFEDDLRSLRRRVRSQPQLDTYHVTSSTSGYFSDGREDEVDDVVPPPSEFRERPPSYSEALDDLRRSQELSRAVTPVPSDVIGRRTPKLQGIRSRSRGATPLPSVTNSRCSTPKPEQHPASGYPVITDKHADTESSFISAVNRSMSEDGKLSSLARDGRPTTQADVHQNAPDDSPAATREGHTKVKHGHVEIRDKQTTGSMSTIASQLLSEDLDKCQSSKLPWKRTRGSYIPPDSGSLAGSVGSLATVSDVTGPQSDVTRPPLPPRPPRRNRKLPVKAIHLNQVEHQVEAQSKVSAHAHSPVRGSSAHARSSTTSEGIYEHVEPAQSDAKSRQRSPGAHGVMTAHQMAAESSSGYHSGSLSCSAGLSGSRQSLSDKFSDKMSGLTSAARHGLTRMRRAVSLERLTSSPADHLRADASYGSQLSLRKGSSLASLKNIKTKLSSGLRRRSKSRDKYVLAANGIKDPTHFRKIGNFKSIHTDGTQTVELNKPLKGTFGFYVAKGTLVSTSDRIYVSRLSDALPPHFFSGLLAVGDEIRAVNDVAVDTMTVDALYDVMNDSQKLVLRTLPVKPRKFHS